MLTITQLEEYLRSKYVMFEIIEHHEPILSVKDAEKYFDSNNAAPVFIMETEAGLVALVISARRGNIDFKKLGKASGFKKFQMADRERITKTTGYEAGAVDIYSFGEE